MARSVLQTQIAVQAVTFADSFRAHLRGTTLGPFDYVADLTEPEGPSTGGGALARQSIRLVPKDNTHPILVVGFANHHTGEAELRTYEYVDVIYRERVSRAVPFDSMGYMKFIESVRAFLEGAGLSVRLAAPPPPSAAPAGASRASADQRGPIVVATVVIALLVTAGALLWLMLSKRG